MTTLQLCLLFCLPPATTPDACRPTPVAAIPGDYIVLLHGYGRSSLSMMRLEWYLRGRGYRVINLRYQSTRNDVEGLAETCLKPALVPLEKDPNARIHFVTHSLGGIILREYLSSHPLDQLGRVVMLAPPNHGSAIVDHARRNPLWRSLLGRSLLELGTGPRDLPAKLGQANFECGVIAGDRSLNPLLSRFLSGPNDGKVTVASARLDGMSDFLVVHNSHTWLMWHRSTINQVLHFLETGRFRHPSAMP
jgi:triacylglycerol lipase